MSEEQLIAEFAKAWKAAQEGVDVDDPAGAEEFAAFVNGSAVPTPGEDGLSEGAAFLAGLTGQREVYINPKALTQKEIDRHDYPEGTPERAYLDWMGYPRPSWMNGANNA